MLRVPLRCLSLKSRLETDFSPHIFGYGTSLSNAAWLRYWARKPAKVLVAPNLSTSHTNMLHVITKLDFCPLNHQPSSNIHIEASRLPSQCSSSEIHPKAINAASAHDDSLNSLNLPLNPANRTQFLPSHSTTFRPAAYDNFCWTELEHMPKSKHARDWKELAMHLPGLPRYVVALDCSSEDSFQSYSYIIN